MDTVAVTWRAPWLSGIMLGVYSLLVLVLLLNMLIAIMTGTCVQSRLVGWLVG